MTDCKWFHPWCTATFCQVGWQREVEKWRAPVRRIGPAEVIIQIKGHPLNGQVVSDETCRRLMLEVPS